MAKILKRAIAGWWFEDRTSLLLEITHKDLYCQLLTLVSCLEVARHERLLLSGKIIFSDSWRTGGVATRYKTQPDKVEFDIKNTASENLSSIISSITIHSLEGEVFFPSCITAMGSGEIDTGSDPLQTPNLVEIKSFFIDTPIIEVNTYCEIWLPYSLDGRQKNPLHKINAERLATLLSKIERITQGQPIYDEVSDYCLINKYHLENMTGDDANDIIGIDERGCVI